MGCDIHLYAEKLNQNGEWETLETWHKEDEGTEYEHLDTKYGEGFYEDRNYDLFAILADVRNGYGFAGCDTGDAYMPIAEPKGLPEDCCAEIKQSSDRWDCDGHSHSYFTVRELLEYDWTQSNKQRGMVDLAHMVQWKNKYMPDLSPRSWCGMTSGGNLLALTPADWALDFSQAKKKLEELEERPTDDAITSMIQKKYEGKRVVYHYQWETPYHYEARSFLGETIPKLLAHCNGNFDSVRIVFWFDN